MGKQSGTGERGALSLIPHVCAFMQSRTGSFGSSRDKANRLQTWRVLQKLDWRAMDVDPQMNPQLAFALEQLARQSRTERTVCLPVISERWWLLLLKGVWAIALACLAITTGVSLSWDLTLIFSALAFVDGLTELALTARGASGSRWWAMIGLGWFEILAGAVAFFASGATLIAQLFFVAAWAIGTGILAMLAAVRLRNTIPGECLLFLFGLVTFALGFLLLTRPETGLHATVALVTAYLSVSGILMIALSFRLHGLRLKLIG